MKIAVSSDSTLSISQKEAQKLGIFVMPLNVLVDGVEYHDGISITNEELAVYMRSNKRISTSTPSPFAIQEYFDNIFAQGYAQVIHFTISSKLSSMFDLFSNTCREYYGDKVLVVDSLSLCHFMANHVITAKNLVDQGLSLEDVAAKIAPRIGTEYALFVPESLTFLKNGGRVSAGVAALGNLMNLRPILTFEKGVVGKKGTTRNLRKGLVKEVPDFQRRGYTSDKYSIEILNFDTSKENIEIIQTHLKKEFPDFEVNISPISINVCAHAGPGTIGVGFNLKINH